MAKTSKSLVGAIDQGTGSSRFLVNFYGLTLFLHFSTLVNSHRSTQEIADINVLL